MRPRRTTGGRGRPAARRPVHRGDPYQQGRREALNAVPKTASGPWVADGGTAEGWYLYSCGYDGVTQATAPPVLARECELAEDIAVGRSMTLAEAEAAVVRAATVQRRW